MPRLGSYPSEAAKAPPSMEGSVDQPLDRLAGALDRLEQTRPGSAVRCPLETLIRDLDVVIALLAVPKDR